MPELAYMIDLETYNNTPDTVIVSVGCVAVDLSCETFIPDFELYMVADRFQQQKVYGRTVSVATIEWWFNQSEDARAVFKNKSKTPLRDILQTMTTDLAYIRGIDPNFTVWSKGVDFDVVILEHAFTQLNMEVPWNYQQRQCFRTLMHNNRKVDVSDITLQGTAHNALDDAKYQARLLHRYIGAKHPCPGLEGGAV